MCDFLIDIVPREEVCVLSSLNQIDSGNVKLTYIISQQQQSQQGNPGYDQQTTYAAAYYPQAGFPQYTTQVCTWPDSH
jgi:hypothetical protein